MTTKPPISVVEASPDSLEKIAYGIVADIPTLEPNDRNRLAYSLWIWMSDRNGTLEDAIRASHVRSPKSLDEIVKTIRARLAARGANTPA